MHLHIVFQVDLQVGFLKCLRRYCQSSPGFSLSQFVLFLHVIPDRLDDDKIRFLCEALAVVRLFVQTKSHWIIKINGKMNVWKGKRIFPTDRLQKRIEIIDLKSFFSW